MSTYASHGIWGDAPDLTLDDGRRIDVAHDVYGRDVRLCLGGSCEYMTPDTAQRVAELLIEAASAARAYDPDDPDGYAPVPPTRGGVS